MAREQANQALDDFRRKIKEMSDEELRALSSVLQRRAADHFEELRAIYEQINENNDKRPAKKNKKD